MARKGNKAPFLAFMDNVRVRDAFAYLTRHKDSYIIRENGKIVDVKEAVRRYKDTKDDKWVMHILMSNLGYFANALGKVAARYGIEIDDYIFYVYEGLVKAMDRADPDMVRLSYLSTGVFMYARKQAEKELAIRNKEGPTPDVADDEGEDIKDLDMIMASQGIYYEVSLSDEDT